MKSTISSLFLTLVAMLFLSVAAFSNSITLDFTSTGSNIVNGVYAYPYYFSILDSTGTKTVKTDFPLMCDDYTDHIAVGDIWKANELSIDDAATANYMDAGHPGTYHMAAWLFSQLTPTNAIDVNSAIWDLFTGGSVPLSSNGATLLSDASGHLTYENPQIMFYTPFGYTHGGAGAPQEFIGDPVATPEPSLALMMITGTALFGLSRLVSKTFGRKRT